MSTNMSLIPVSSGTIPQEVLEVLLTHEPSIPNRVVKAFVQRYVKTLSTCSQEEAEILPSGRDIKLRRWESEEGGSYGYDPSCVAYAYAKLNKLFWGIMTDACRRHSLPAGTPEKRNWPELVLRDELLRNIAACLGFSVLVSYFTSSESNNDPGKQWFAGLIQISGEFEDMDTWRLDILDNRIRQSLSPYNLLYAPKSPTSPYYNNKWGNVTPMQVLEAERIRLVSFMRSLRQTIEVLRDDPLMVNAKWQVITTQSTPTNGTQSP